MEPSSASLAASGGERDRRVRKSTVAEMERALTGHYREELVFVLEQGEIGVDMSRWRSTNATRPRTSRPVLLMLRAKSG